MATDDDNFDIDIYGDGSGYSGEQDGDYKTEEPELVLDAEEDQPNGVAGGDGSEEKYGNDNNAGTPNQKIFKTEKTSEPSSNQQQQPQTQIQQQQQPQHQDPPAPQQFQQDSKRIDSDPNATAALYISELHWWTTDDEVRGWVNQAGVEQELKDVTFSEHKVNGKSKGQVFAEFTSTQAAAAVKHKIENLHGSAPSARKYVVNYTQPNINPFRTLPKENTMRGKDNMGQRPSGGFNNTGTPANFNAGNTGGFRGGRGGFNRGGMNQGMGGFNNNRNFSNPMGGGNFQNPNMGAGFQGGPMGGMQNYGFNNRGGMMNPNMRGGNMRGGRGGMGGPMPNNMMNVGGMGGVGAMGGMGMGGMPMGGMPPQMGNMMGGMQGGNMGMQGQGGFQNQNPHFNPAFFGGGDAGTWNPHGAKRARQD